MYELRLFIFGDKEVECIATTTSPRFPRKGDLMSVSDVISRKHQGVIFEVHRVVSVFDVFEFGKPETGLQTVEVELIPTQIDR